MPLPMTTVPPPTQQRKCIGNLIGVQSVSRVFRSAMPRAPSPASPDLAGLALLDEEDDDDQEPIGAGASIQAAAKKCTRPH